MRELEVVERCLLLFSKPGRWTQRTNARDRDGKTVPFDSPLARTFSLEGAIRRAAGDRHKHFYGRFFRRYDVYEDKDGKLKTIWIDGPAQGMIAPFRNQFDWNDAKHRTQRDVVNLLEDLADAYRFKEEQ